jgi:AraC-like DNA-binding protein
MSFDWDLVIRAFGLLMSAQLALLCLLMIREKKYLLAGLGYLQLAWFLRRFFWGLHAANPVLIVLISGGQELFVPPVLYLLIHRLCKNQLPARPVVYFIPSALFFLYYVVLRIAFTQQFSEINSQYFFFVYIGYLCTVTGYFGYKSWWLLKTHRKTLVRRAYLKYSFLFWLFFPHWIIASLLSIPGTADRYHIPWLIRLAESLPLSPFYAITYGISFVQGMVVILVLISELAAFKKWLLPKNIHQPLESDPGKIALNLDEIRHKNLHLKPTLTLEETARELQVSKKQLSAYLNQIANQSFIHYINSLRIATFKELLQAPESSRYDMASIAQMAGFSSKATFNRVFKEQEGITPSQFKKQLADD